MYYILCQLALFLEVSRNPRLRISASDKQRNPALVLLKYPAPAHHMATSCKAKVRNQVCVALEFTLLITMAHSLPKIKKEKMER